MKVSFYIAAMAITMVAGVAGADSVDIGLGRMDQAEFGTLRQMVSGDFQPSAFVATERPRESQVAEFDQGVVDEIRLAMTDDSPQGNITASVATEVMVDIGIGSVSTNEFYDLNKLVVSNSATPKSGFAYICF